MNWKKVLHSAICLLVVCSILLTMVPVKAEAVLLESGLAIGIAACLILATAGVVFNPETVEDIKAIGNSFQTYMYQWGEDNNKQTEVQEGLSSIVIINPFGASDGESDGEDDGSWESPNDTKIKLARGILKGITAWVGAVILNQIVIEKEGEEAPEGYAYYNGVLLKKFNWDTEEFPYAIIFKSGSSYFFVKGESPFYCRHETSGFYVRQFENGTFWQYKCGSDGSAWYYNNDASNTYFYHAFSSLIWSNHDVFEYAWNDSYYPTDILYLAGSEPVYAQTEIIEPSVYVGDVPSDLQEGNITEEEIPLVDIDYSQVLPQGQTALQSIQSLAGQLESGSMTYEDYLEKIKIDSESDSGGDTETDGGTDTGTLGQIQQDSFWAKLTSTLASPFEWLADTVMSGIKSIFVPSEDFLSSKVTALRERFSFVDSIIGTAEFIRDSINGDVSPPVIYIDLSAAEGSYYLGEKEILVDFAWYERYKDSVDALMSAILWAFFAWRVFQRAPAIIGGDAGVLVRDFMAEKSFGRKKD